MQAELGLRYLHIAEVYSNEVLKGFYLCVRACMV